MVLVKGQPSRTFLVVQWLRICLPMQGTWVQSLGEGGEELEVFSGAAKRPVELE